jgi:hypothetical protein
MYGLHTDFQKGKQKKATGHQKLGTLSWAKKSG